MSGRKRPVHSGARCQRLADADLYSAKWSVHIRDEWTRSLLGDRPGMGVQIAAAAQAMEDGIPDCLVSGYEHLIESFNGKFRDECLNERRFETLQQARSAITLWRQDYNEIRPHSSCQRMPPSCIAGALAMQLDPAHQPPRSINLATPDFLVMNGTAEGGRSYLPSFTVFPFIKKNRSY